jgi:hypothetical protein
VFFEFDVALGESNVHRRRPGKERKAKKELRAYRLRGSRHPHHDQHSTRQRLGNSWLNDQVGGVANRTIGLNRLAVCVRVSGLRDPAESDQRTAEKAEHYPQQMTCC